MPLIDHGMASGPWNCLFRSLPKGVLVQAGPREGRGPETVLCYCTDFVARAATCKKPAGHHPRTPDKIGAKELRASITLSLLLCGVVGKKHGWRSFAWFLISQRERLKFDCVVIWKPWMKRPMWMLTLVRILQSQWFSTHRKLVWVGAGAGLDLTGFLGNSAGLCSFLLILLFVS